MTKHHSDWIFNISLNVAVLICLGTLAVALFTGAGPLTAVFRSGTAFTVFVVLGWALAIVWQVPEPEKQDAAAESDGSAADTQSSDEGRAEQFTPDKLEPQTR